ncbi:MAG: membrane integrity-associated transporter subunit PqiC [Gammaproteobacteria bacterium]|nr:membrane integrity-associated transporter subunit PqiC [Gammaproteobacteria bacterium]
MRKMLPLLLMLSSWLSGCSSTPPSRFYVLTAEVAGGADSDGRSGLVLGVGPIRLADYLERPQIVARESDNRLKLEEFDRWGGSLETNIKWVMAENLSRVLGSDAVVAFPWERAVVPDYQVTIDIRRFDPTDNNQILLSVQWHILGDDGRELLSIARSDISEPIGGSGFEAQVAAQSRALARLSREIAQRLQQYR